MEQARKADALDADAGGVGVNLMNAVRSGYIPQLGDPVKVLLDGPGRGSRPATLTGLSIASLDLMDATVVDDRGVTYECDSGLVIVLDPDGFLDG